MEKYLTSVTKIYPNQTQNAAKDTIPTNPIQHTTGRPIKYRTASSRIKELKIYVTAMIWLEWFEEAEESVGKLNILYLQDMKVIGLMEQLDVRG